MLIQTKLNMALCVGLITGQLGTLNRWGLGCHVPPSRILFLVEPSWEVTSKTNVQQNALSDLLLGVSPVCLSSLLSCAW